MYRRGSRNQFLSILRDLKGFVTFSGKKLILHDDKSMFFYCW